MAKKKIDLEEDAKSPAPTPEQLSNIYSMVATMRKHQKEAAELAEKAGVAANKAMRLSEAEIPEAMKAIGLKKLPLEDGSELEIKEDDYGSYTKPNEPAVFRWLRKNGHASMIKNQLSILFGKDDATKIKKLEKVLSQKGYAGIVVEKKESVHAGTFKAFVREQLLEGKALPKQIAIFHKSETVIKEPKNGKATKRSKQDLF